MSGQRGPQRPPKLNFPLKDAETEAQRAACQRVQTWALFSVSANYNAPSLVGPSVNGVTLSSLHPLFPSSHISNYLSGSGRKPSELSCLSPLLVSHIGGCDTDISTSEPYPLPPLSSKLPCRGASGPWVCPAPLQISSSHQQKLSRVNCLMRPIFCFELLIKEQTQPTVNLVLGKKLGLQQTEENSQGRTPRK